MQGKEIKDRLKSLIAEASSVDSTLAKRLGEINRWIKDVKPGSLVAKKFVTAFLLQVIRDSTIWLAIQSLPSPEAQQFAFEQMTPAEKYWYSDLFPKWLNQNDSKFEIWKQKLMAGDFNQPDAGMIQSTAENIMRRGSTVWQCYIADLSMATDLIVSHRQSNPLCLQITRVSDQFSQEKYDNWKHTLQNWGIQRGLFLSYNPATPDFLNQLVNLALYNSDHLKVGSYLKFP